MAEPNAIETFIKDAEGLARSIRAYLERSDNILHALETDGLDESVLSAQQLDLDAIDENALQYVASKIDAVPLDELKAAAAEDAAQPFLAYCRDTITAREKIEAIEAAETIDRIVLTIKDEPNQELVARAVEDRWRTVDETVSNIFDPEGAHQQAKIGAFAALALKAHANPDGLKLDRAFEEIKSQRRYLTRYVVPAWQRASIAGRNPVSILQPPTWPHTEGLGDECCDRIVDAISRLQEGGGGGLGSTGSTGYAASSGDFGKALDQQIYSTIGLPNLISDTALSADKSKLVNKLVTGLDRAVLKVEKGETTQFVFNPAQARAVAPLDGGQALGAQAIVAESITSLKPTILRYVDLLQPEICECSEEEIDDIKDDIERSLDLLATETRTSVGVFSEWAMTLIGRIASDVAALVDLYGIRVARPVAFERLCELLHKQIGFSTDFSVGQEGRTVDRDVGFLTREANDQAIGAIFEHLLSITDLLRDLKVLNKGPVLVRLRAVVDAVPPAVSSARSALNLAGVGEVDRTAFFTTVNGSGITGNDVIDLARLLTWIESCANDWRSRLLEVDLNSRDLSWLAETLTVQSRALASVVSENGATITSPDFATINDSRFALGVRQIREVSRHLNLARDLVDELRSSITDRGRPAPKPSERHIPA